MNTHTSNHEYHMTIVEN